MSTAIPVEKFGRDHWSLLAYIETVCVDHRGIPDLRRMRCDRERHPGLALPLHPDGAQYPTRLAGGELRPHHDDWDCAEDLQAAGLIAIEGTGIHPRFAMTDAGRAWTARLREERQSRHA